GGPANVRPELEAGRQGVDQEFAADGVARRVIAPALDARARTVLDAPPDHDEITPASHRDRGLVLGTRRVRVDLELASAWSPRRCEPLAEYPVPASVLVVALPDDDEVPVRLHGRARVALPAGGVGVHAELPARGSLARSHGGEGKTHRARADDGLRHRKTSGPLAKRASCVGWCET